MQGTANNGCWGIAADTGGYGTSEFFNGLTIRGNFVYNVGNQGISAGICQNCVIEDNLVVMDGVSGYGIKAPATTPACSGCPGMTAMTFRNNTIYYGSTSAQDSIGIYLGDYGTGHVIANNATLAADPGANFFSCFQLNLAPSAYAHSDHNDCSYSGTGGVWEYARGSLASWRTFSGQDANSITTNPAFTSPASPTYNFIPGSGSPLIGAGDSSYCSTVDILGNTRPVPCDIGAYQH